MDTETLDDLRLQRWVGFFLPTLVLAVFAPWNPDLVPPDVPRGDPRYEMGNVLGVLSALSCCGSYLVALGAHLALCFAGAGGPRSGLTPSDSD